MNVGPIQLLFHVVWYHTVTQIFRHFFLFKVIRTLDNEQNPRKWRAMMILQVPVPAELYGSCPFFIYTPSTYCRVC